MRARVRGIYATALTQVLLDAGHDVVQASAPIRRRFDAEFEAAPHDVDVETTDDRQGVGVAGEHDAVAAVVTILREIGIDTLAWAGPAPRGAVFDARVAETLGSGAVCDLGEVTGFLPYGNVDDRVQVGDARRVRVVEAAAPWGDDRPVLDESISAEAGLAALVPGEGVRVDTRDEAAGRELAGVTDLLSVDVPDGWGVRWDGAAADADMDALADALSTAVERARGLSDLPDEVGEPRRLAAPTATTWVWFGRASRFALDETRRAVATTMPGHHRIKAASSAASTGVDFVEALCDPEEPADLDFPFAAVTDQFGPVEGDTVTIEHGKPDGRLITLGRGEVTERGADGSLTVERAMKSGGRYDALGTRRTAGDTAVTTFREGRWWYPTVYRSVDGERRGTYVNVCTPVECFPSAVRYVDLHVDVVKRPDGTVERVDDDELDAAVEAGHLTAELADRARTVASSIERAL